MPYVKTTATKKVASLSKRIRAVAGGTSASKTISIISVMIASAQLDPGSVNSIVAESLPALRRGAIRDFHNIMSQNGFWRRERWNETNSVYTFENNSIIEFFGADEPDKMKGSRRHRLFINEANNVKYSVFEQLEVRTEKVIFLDWNPTREFWFYSEVLPNRSKDIDFITLTYIDNEALSQSVIDSIESRKNNLNWWRVYGLGQLGSLESQIYQDWEIISNIPVEARLDRYGLDFGYTNDPTAIIAIYYIDGGYIFDEILYSTGLTNDKIAHILLQQKEKVLIKADSAEPKSIDEIRNYGLYIEPASKGKDSVIQGINYIQQLKIQVTARSVSLIKEYRNYLFKSDRDGKIINEPQDFDNHCMDAIRYGLDGLYKPIEKIVDTRSPQEIEKEEFWKLVKADVDRHREALLNKEQDAYNNWINDSM